MVHEGNKDESEKCLELAQQFFSSGNRPKAMKFAEKAEKLFPCQKNRDFIELLTRLDETTTKASTTRRPSAEDVKENVRQRATQNTSSAAKEYTTEQIEAVRKVKKCKDYYEILGVTKTAGDSDLKKAYRKLALQFHPDKNKAPGADEAFKAVGNAFAVLSDVEKRKNYDLFGADEKNSGQSHRSHYSYSQGGQEADITAEELFNMFFGGGGVYMRRGGNYFDTSERSAFRHHHRAPHYHHHSHESSNSEQSSLSVFLQLLPLLMILLLSVASSLINSEPTYALSATNKFSVMRTTGNLGVSYYVKQDFSSEYQGSIKRLEQQVEEDYVATLRNACFKEKNYKENMLWRARSFGDAQMFKRAQDLRTQSCDALQNLYNHHN